MSQPRLPDLDTLARLVASCFPANHKELSELVSRFKKGEIKAQPINDFFKRLGSPQLIKLAAILVRIEPGVAETQVPSELQKKTINATWNQQLDDTSASEGPDESDEDPAAAEGARPARKRTRPAEAVLPPAAAKARPYEAPLVIGAELEARLAEAAEEQGLAEVDRDVAPMLALALKQRLTDMLHELVRLSLHRHEAAQSSFANVAPGPDLRTTLKTIVGRPSERGKEDAHTRTPLIGGTPTAPGAKKPEPVKPREERIGGEETNQAAMAAIRDIGPRKKPAAPAAAQVAPPDRLITIEDLIAYMEERDFVRSYNVALARGVALVPSEDDPIGNFLTSQGTADSSYSLSSAIPTILLSLQRSPQTAKSSLLFKCHLIPRKPLIAKPDTTDDVKAFFVTPEDQRDFNLRMQQLVAQAQALAAAVDLSEAAQHIGVDGVEKVDRLRADLCSCPALGHRVLDAEIAELAKQKRELQGELVQIGQSIAVEKKRSHQIERLHEYNDLKDAAGVMIGKLADAEGKLVKTVYEELGLSRSD
ncbi:hypothetical protein PAPYR_1058 [Paratrimastix pyriformis]|uniref:Transcription initiation factor TFIID component TAF4 C-terminal domain-containing protein n=1 Tax=Paratrimastix pyriformis TaxID=342808 RepID=A0ABQ8UVJ0_9EUKA|nr:hypothetical protein PAPYR_1058 [Paratrimastix pyriformis]